MATTTARAGGATTTIRVSVAVRDQLQARAETEGGSVGEVVRRLLEIDEENRYWEEMRRAVERTRANPEEWAEYQAEIELWDTTLGDGLQMDEDWTGMWDAKE